MVSFITNSISRNFGTFRRIAISRGGRMKTRKWTICEVESFEVRNWRGLKTAISLSVEMLIIRKASNDSKMDLKIDKLKDLEYYLIYNKYTSWDARNRGRTR